MSKPKFILYFVFLLLMLVSSAKAYSPQFVDKEKTIKMHWKNKQIPIAISESLLTKVSNIKTNCDVLVTIKNSLKHWEEVADIKFNLTVSKAKSVSRKDSKGDRVSLITIAQTTDNLLLFGEKLDKASAITRLFYDKKGNIKEADIVLNPILLFSCDGTFRSFDLEATLTHEIGHFIGLGHSRIYGSTMHSHQGKNGVYNLAGYSSRTLSEDDKAGAISLYGKRKTDIKCCSILSGKISTQHLIKDKQFQFWLEEANSAKVIAGILSDNNGGFSIEGIPNAKYKMYVQGVNDGFGTKYIGEIELFKNQTKVIKKEINTIKNDFSLRYIGLNGQLANIAIPVTAGKNYTIYIGGTNVNKDDLNIQFHSRHLTVIKNSLLEHNYGIGISVFSFEVQVDEETPKGDYSFFITKKDLDTKYIVGGLTVEPRIF